MQIYLYPPHTHTGWRVVKFRISRLLKPVQFVFFPRSYRYMREHVNSISLAIPVTSRLLGVGGAGSGKRSLKPAPDFGEPSRLMGHIVPIIILIIINPKPARNPKP